MGDETELVGKIALSREENAMLREELRMLHDTLVKVACETPTPKKRRGSSVGMGARSSGTGTATPKGKALHAGSAAPRQLLTSATKKSMKYTPNCERVVDSTTEGRITAMAATSLGRVWCARETRVITIYNQFRDEYKSISPKLTDAHITFLAFLKGGRALMAVCFSDGMIEMLGPDGDTRVPSTQAHTAAITAATPLNVHDQKLATAAGSSIVISYPSQDGALKEHAVLSETSDITVLAEGKQNAFYTGTQAGRVSRWDDKKRQASRNFPTTILSLLCKGDELWTGLAQGEGIVVSDAATLVQNRTFTGTQTLLLSGPDEAVWGINYNGFLSIWSEGGMMTTIASGHHIATGCSTADNELWIATDDAELHRWRGEGYCKEKFATLKQTATEATKNATAWEEQHAREAEKNRKLADTVDQHKHTHNVTLKDNSILQNRLRKLEASHGVLRQGVITAMTSTLSHDAVKVTYTDTELLQWVRDMAKPHSLAYHNELINERNELQHVSRALKDQLGEAIETHSSGLQQENKTLLRENLDLCQSINNLRESLVAREKEVAKNKQEMLTLRAEGDTWKAEAAVQVAEKSKLIQLVHELEAAAKEKESTLSELRGRVAIAEDTSKRLSKVSFERDNLASKVFTDIPARRVGLVGVLASSSRRGLLSNYWAHLRCFLEQRRAAHSASAAETNTQVLRTSNRALAEDKQKLTLLVEKLKEAQKRSNVQLHMAATELGELKK